MQHATGHERSAEVLALLGIALADAFITQRDAIPPERREELALLVGKYLA